MADAPRLTPRRVFAGLAALAVIAVLLAPLPQSVETPGLSSFGTGPGGAGGLYETLDRLGFAVERWREPMRGELDPNAAWLVLSPEIQPTPSEVHRLLDAVRAGAGLLVLPTNGSRLADSLGLRPVPVVPFPVRGGAWRDSIAYGRGLVAWVLRPLEDAPDSVLRTTPGVRWFLTVHTRYGTEPVVLGRALGRGRVVVAANADLFSNAGVRTGGPAVRVVRLVEWLNADEPGRRLRFDEYHHGFGQQASVTGLVGHALVHTPVGRVVLQLASAALLLLIAVAIRPIRPLPRRRIERRSPLEHVSALAAAYREAGATGRAARLLVRGVRRRHGGVQSSIDDAVWLRRLAGRYPESAPDVDILIAGIEERDGTPSADSIAAAVRNIEQVVST